MGQLLTAHPKLAKEKLLPRDSVTPPARCALWNTIPALADIPQDYEDMAMAGATGVASVNARVQWNAEWLKKIARACAPDKTLQVLHAIRNLRWLSRGGAKVPIRVPQGPDPVKSRVLAIQTEPNTLWTWDFVLVL